MYCMYISVLQFRKVNNPNDLPPVLVVSNENEHRQNSGEVYRKLGKITKKQLFRWSEL